MLNFLTSWTGILLGGGFAASIVLLICIYLVGGQKVVDLATDFLRPPLMAIANMAGDVLRLVWENFRDGLAFIAQSVKALFAVAVIGSVVAAVVYFPTKHTTAKKTEAHVVRTLHVRYRFIPKPKPKTVAQSAADAIHKSLGGL